MSVGAGLAMLRRSVPVLLVVLAVVTACGFAALAAASLSTVVYPAGAAVPVGPAGVVPAPTVGGGG